MGILTRGPDLWKITLLTGPTAECARRVRGRLCVGLLYAANRTGVNIRDLSGFCPVKRDFSPDKKFFQKRVDFIRIFRYNTQLYEILREEV